MAYSTSEEFLKELWRLQDGNAPVKAIVLPSDEIIYNVNLNTRTIETPSFLSVERDQGAETIYFLVDRFFGEIDLATTACFIQFINSNVDPTERAGFYPVPFFDISTYSSHVVEQGFEEVYVQSGTYTPNKFYIKNGEQYILATEKDFNEGATYYKIASPETNRRYIVDNNVNANTYKPGVYYYINPNTGEYVLDEGLEYNPFVIKQVYNAETDKMEDVECKKTFYKAISKSFIKANVDGNNYRARQYYIYNAQTKEMEFDIGGTGYRPDIEYYTLIDKPKILFPWSLRDTATEVAGTLQFSIQFYRMSDDGKELVYSLNTRPAASKILEGMYVEVSDEEFEEKVKEHKLYDLETYPADSEIVEYWNSIQYHPTTLQDIYYRIALKNDIYWIEA